ncbi:MAG: GTP pyrophosphokinase family protein [Eubacteriales bacterium]|nr:GTP pyrophosphokinase family protein [Eubacteriales bacterium]
MGQESIYGDQFPELEKIRIRIQTKIDELRSSMKKTYGLDPVEHCLSRIKAEDSMREKCRRKGLPETTESALQKIHDAIGFRIVCTFLDDIYVIRDYLKEIEGVEVIEEKDYIRHVKPNGYRSYHMILLVDGRHYVEIQLRTISMDTWAALEHHLKYKKKIRGNEDLIVAELKRCANTLASTDISMQAIKQMIFDEGEEE